MARKCTSFLFPSLHCHFIPSAILSSRKILQINLLYPALLTLSRRSDSFAPRTRQQQGRIYFFDHTLELICNQTFHLVSQNFKSTARSNSDEDSVGSARWGLGVRPRPAGGRHELVNEVSANEVKMNAGGHLLPRR